MPAKKTAKKTATKTSRKPAEKGGSRKTSRKGGAALAAPAKERGTVTKAARGVLYGKKPASTAPTREAPKGYYAYQRVFKFDDGAEFYNKAAARRRFKKTGIGVIEEPRPRTGRHFGGTKGGARRTKRAA